MLLWLLGRCGGGQEKAGGKAPAPPFLAPVHAWACHCLHLCAQIEWSPIISRHDLRSPSGPVPASLCPLLEPQIWPGMLLHSFLPSGTSRLRGWQNCSLARAHNKSLHTVWCLHQGLSLRSPGHGQNTQGKPWSVLRFVQGLYQRLPSSGNATGLGWKKLARIRGKPFREPCFRSARKLSLSGNGVAP